VIKPKLTPKQKALAINLDSSIYGTFAEIGAGKRLFVIFSEQVELLKPLQKQCLLMTKTFLMPSMVKKPKPVCNAKSLRKMLRYDGTY
jgi:hypothetical protein